MPADLPGCLEFYIDFYIFKAYFRSRWNRIPKMVSKEETVKSVLSVIGVLLLSLAGCSPRVALSTALMKEYRLANADLLQLQFYLSDGLLLEQEVTTINKDIDPSHSLSTLQDSRIKQVYFKKLTPCVATGSESNGICVAFEQGDCLTFRLKNIPKQGDSYVYQPEGEFREKGSQPRLPDSDFRDWKRIGKEKYKELDYVALIKNDPPFLLVNKKALKNLEVDRVVAPGIKLKAP